MKKQHSQSQNPKPKTVVSQEDLRRIANLIGQYSEKYMLAAEMMLNSQIDSIEIGGVDTLEEKTLKLLRGNAYKVLATVQAEIDAKELILLAESKQNYVFAASPAKSSNRKGKN